MSLNNRARFLQGITTLSYQEARSAVSLLGNAPKEFRDTYKWSIHRADAFLFDRQLDSEFVDVSSKSQKVEIKLCGKCGVGFFYGEKTTATNCPRCP